MADQHVESAELFHRAADEAFEVLTASDVGAAGDGPPAPIADAAGNFLESFVPACPEDDGRTVLGKQQGGGFTDAAAGPGDSDDLAFNP